MLRNTLFVAVALLVSLASFSQTTGKLVLKKGQKYIVENKFTTVSKQEAMGQSMESKANISTVNSIEVSDIKDNNYALTNTFTKITLNMTAMGQDMNFDSDKKEDMDGEMGKNMKDIINHPKALLVNNQGKIIKGENDTAKKEPGNDMMSMMMQQFVGNQEEGGFGVSEAFAIIPSNQKAGFSWTDSSSSNGVKKSMTYTIKEIKGNEATVTIAGVLDTDTKMEMNGMEIGNKATGKVAGEQVIDLKTGVIKQKTTNLESSGIVQAMGQEIPTSTTVSTVSTVKSM